MNLIIFLQLLVRLLSVAGYTVVLKQVKPVHPPLKVYRYELRHAKIIPEANVQYIYHKPVLGQRIYPVTQKSAFKPRVPVVKEPGKYYKTSATPAIKDQRVTGGLPQHLVPPISNQVEEYSEAKEEDEIVKVNENDVRPFVFPDSEKSFSSFGQEKGRIYKNAGEWATTPAPKEEESENTTQAAEFKPSQLYLQIRHKNTVIHVPQSEALKDAETLEELINAPRLKELARTTHVQETYSEEGYEDAGYDHAGHIRQAQHGEVYEGKDEGKFRIKEPPVILDYDSDLEESKKVPVEENNGDLGGTNSSNKLEPRITRSRSKISKTSVEYTNIPTSYKGEHKYSSRVKSTDEKPEVLNTTEPKDFSSKEPVFPSYFGEMPPAPEITFNISSSTYKPPLNKISSRYRKEDLNSTQIYPVTELPPPDTAGYTDFNPYMSMIDSQASPSAKSLKYSRIYSKKTKQLLLEPYKKENIYPLPRFQTTERPPAEDLQPPPMPVKEPKEERLNQRIILPTIGYINSLTTAHFGKENPKPPQEDKPQLTNPLNLTQALDYLRSTKNHQNLETTKPPTEFDIRTFESMKLKKTKPQTSVNKIKREIDRRSNEEYEGNDESDLPHNEKNEEIDEDERRRIEEENEEKENYERELREEISKQEKEIIKETFDNIGVQEDISEVFPELPPTDPDSDYSSEEETTPTPVDVKKYPFYLSKRLPENSPLRYATDPRKFPKKSGYKMEFYESREGVIQCPDFHPDLENLPNSNSTDYSEDQAGENQRLTGLGDKIACLRMKYFDPEPFDNPIFKEKEIDYVGKPIKGRKIVPVTRGSKEKHVKSQQASEQKFTKIKPKKPIINETRFNNAETSSATPQTSTATHSTPKPYKFQKKSPVIGWKTTYHTNYQPRVYPVPQIPYNRIVLPHNCLHQISNLAMLDGTRNLTIECNDARIIQEIIKNVARLRIIPKEVKKENKWSNRLSSDQNDWVPIVGYPVKRFNKAALPITRRTDEVTLLKDESGNNGSSNHFVIDELKEDENVRKGEVVDDMDHYLKMMESLKEEKENVETTTVKSEKPQRRRRETSLKRKRQTENNPDENVTPTDTFENYKPLEKRPLMRLSGRDFLVRYHKNKGKPTTQKTEDFWKITTPQPQGSKNTPKSPKKFAIPERSTEISKPTTTQVFLESTTLNYKPRESPQFPKPDPPTEKPIKIRLKQPDPRKTPSAKLIPDKITKRPDGKSSEFRKPSPRNPVVEKATEVSKVARETEETLLLADNPANSSNRSVEAETTSVKPVGLPQYKTINRNPSPAVNESKHLSRATEDPEGVTLYYVVNLKTGRGKWITNYEEQVQGNAGSNQKPKDNFQRKREKRRKKTKNRSFSTGNS